MLVSIVIPVYNSPVLEELAERIARVFAERPEDDFEIIFVDDSSPNPATWPTLESIARERPNVTAIQLTRNFGQHPATLCGLKESRGDVVFTMDDDLQHNPEDIPKFLELIDWDIVIGQFARKEHGLFKRGMSRLKGYFDWFIIGKPRHIHLSSYRMLHRTVVDGVLAIYTPNPFIPALMFRVSKRVIGVEVGHERRREGKSGYTLVKQVRLFSNLIINNSSIILRTLGHIGLVFAMMSFCYAAYVVYRTFVHGQSVQGWSSLMVAVLLIGGLVLFSVGIMGEYLIRIIETAETKPTYFVRRAVSVRSPYLTGSPRGD